MFNIGVSKGSQESHSVNYQRTGHELASVDELAVLDGSKCILQLRGVRPFLSDKEVFMAAYISIPRDLTRVKSKVFFGLTKRQLASKIQLDYLSHHWLFLL